MLILICFRPYLCYTFTMRGCATPHGNGTKKLSRRVRLSGFREYQLLDRDAQRGGEQA